MNTRRAFLKTAAAAVAGGAMNWAEIARASEGKPLLVRDAKIIRVRRPQGRGNRHRTWRSASESGLRGYAGPLLKEQAAAFPANLRELLAGRDAADPGKLNFATLWAACHPGKCAGELRGGERPADRRGGVGRQRTTAPLPRPAG